MLWWCIYAVRVSVRAYRLKRFSQDLIHAISRYSFPRFLCYDVNQHKTNVYAINIPHTPPRMVCARQPHRMDGVLSVLRFPFRQDNDFPLDMFPLCTHIIALDESHRVLSLLGRKDSSYSLFGVFCFYHQTLLVDGYCKSVGGYMDDCQSVLLQSEYLVSVCGNHEDGGQYGRLLGFLAGVYGLGYF